MDRQVEIELIDELLELKTNKSHFLDASSHRNPMQHYTDLAHFNAEQEAVFKRLPQVAAHCSELKKPGDFVRREMAGLPILLTRDKAGQLHAFLNVCRHRGTRLVDDERGCKHRFSCPYHAWTYASSGELIAAPHFDSGFPEEEKAKLGLTRLACQEAFGFIWVLANCAGTLDMASYFEDLAEDLSALGIDDMVIAAEHSEIRDANWKILVEGGIEAYHFKVAHRTTIGPHFEDNLSSYRTFGPHMRSILPRTSLSKLQAEARETWRLRDHANVLYTLFPSSQLLVQQDHIVWIKQTPLAPDRTALRLATLVPQSQAGNTEHWQRNHEITRVTLEEDFAIGESMQGTATSGANSNMLFGRFEGALHAFNQTVSAQMQNGAFEQSVQR